VLAVELAMRSMKAQGMIATKVTAFVLFVKLHGVRRKGMKYWPL